MSKDSTDKKCLIAAAGAGKTESIVKRVEDKSDLSLPALVLTHTNAGVAAIRNRLRRREVPSSHFRVDTIARFALQWARSFPETTGYSPFDEQPDFSAAYDCATTAFQIAPIRRVLSRSYDELLVDEYQDCTTAQHDFVLVIADTLPCRIYGDPLQGVFAFGDGELIDWREDILPKFEINTEERPWRWDAEGNDELGEHLRQIRRKLIDGGSIDLENGPNAFQWKKQPSNPSNRVRENCRLAYRLMRRDGPVFLLRKWRNQVRDTASKLGGNYQCIEPLTDDSLRTHAESLGDTTGLERAVALFDAVDDCATKVGSTLRGMRDRLAEGKRSQARKYSAQADALHAFADAEQLDWDLARIAIDTLLDLDDAIVYRRELLDELRTAIREYAAGEDENLVEAAERIRRVKRFTGRRLPHHCAARPIMVKGLECDHVLLIGASDFGRKELYVAMTRAKESVTIISSDPKLKFEPSSLSSVL